MSYYLPIPKATHLLNNNGTYRALVVDKDSTSTETEDGSWKNPYKTIQAAITALPDPGVDAEHSRIGTPILIVGGEYTETPAFSGEGIVELVPIGTVRLIGTLTYTVTSAAFSNQLNIRGKAGQLIITSHLTYADGSSGYDVDSILENVSVGGNVVGTALTGTLRVEVMESTVTGSFTATSADLIADHAIFSSTLSINRFLRAVLCDYYDDITVVASGGDVLQCTFVGAAKVWTGAVGSFRVDGYSNDSFVVQAWTFAGGATRVVLDVIDGTKCAVAPSGGTVSSPMVVHYQLVPVQAAGSPVTTTITIDDKIQVVGFRVILDAAGTGGSTYQLFKDDGGTNAISESIDVSGGADNDVFEATSIDNAYSTVGAGDDLDFVQNAAAHDCPAARCFVYGVRVT